MIKMLLSPIKLLDNFMDRIFTTLGAIIFVQFPQFYSAYIQRLGGHLDEAQHEVDEYAKAAFANHLTLPQYITIHLTSTNQVFVSTGKLIQGLVERLQHLQSSIETLKGASPLGRGWTFLKEMDFDIAKQTLANFTPGIPITIEAFVYALIGLVLFFGIYQGVKRFILFVVKKLGHSKSTSQKPMLSI